MRDFAIVTILIFILACATAYMMYSVFLVLESQAEHITALQNDVAALNSRVEALEYNQGGIIENQDKCQWMEKFEHLEVK